VRLTNLLCSKVWIGVVVIRSLSMALFLSETQYQKPYDDISARLIAIPHPSRIRRTGPSSGTYDPSIDPVNIYRLNLGCTETLRIAAL
jgi:hypothetical protein